MNLREQQDAVEFFNSLVECVDEALKALNHEQIMIKTLGGSYSDQKICKGCPHRSVRCSVFGLSYSYDISELLITFNVFYIDIQERNHLVCLVWKSGTIQLY